MGEEKESKGCVSCMKFCLKPITRENVFFHYLPMTSMASYGALAVNVTNPALIGRLVPNKDITNVLLLQTLIGTTLYIYKRPHLENVSSGKKAAISITGSALFGLGSVLLWAMTRSLAPKNSVLTTLLGLATGAAIIKIGTDYFEIRDRK